MNRLNCRRIIGLVAALVLLPAFLQGVSAQTVGTVPMESTSAYQMTSKAIAFLNTLDDPQSDIAQFPIDSNERTRWSNLPPQGLPRSGLRIGDLTELQRMALHELLRASLSSQGYLKVSGVMHMEQLVGDIMADLSPDDLGIDRGAFWPGRRDEFPFTPEFQNLLTELQAGNQPLTEEYIASLGDLAAPAEGDGMDYYVAFFGTPAPSTDWAWLIGGHHLAVSFTITEGRVGFTPYFLGSAPLVVRRGRETGWSPLTYESDRGFELMESLSPEQQSIALISSDREYDVMAGPGRRDSLSRFEGLKSSEMNAQQQVLLRVLVEEYVRNADFDAAEAQLAVINEAGWDELWFSWRGPVSEQDDLFYYRVHGPRILIELAWETWNHVHTMVRDPANDYGEDWLGHHYETHHPASERGRELGWELMEYIRREAENGVLDELTE